MSNAINKSLINPLVKKWFATKAAGVAVYCTLTLGVVGMSGLTAHKAYRSTLAKDYNRNKSVRMATGNSRMHITTFDTSRHPLIFMSGVIGGMLIPLGVRSLARTYLRFHKYTPLRDLLTVTSRAYLGIGSAVCLTTSFFSLKSTHLYYERYPHKLDRFPNFGN